ncbi:ribonuclease J [Candidatus Phytoplasma gossypii]|uniref:Ribonuclease J n=1 Tax=Candidatus Phytoplasma gossypii TaxID=2982629 RepID=A0ABT9D1F3_9MOLU|nr:ribonuclease J ['Gossypium sp.' phytoplasma]MDO8057505.1 ribonuclease J ['Gossypium sp.' phytoplasma]
MQEINFFALGGIGENGKNFYLLKINSSYFILDAGLKYPSVLVNGIDAILPEYHKLESIKGQIKGIFITSALETYSGALVYFIKEWSIPIYTSDFTMEVIKFNLKQANIDLSFLSFNMIKDDMKITIDNIKIFVFGISHFLPGTLGLAFETSSGMIIYMSAMHMQQSKNNFFQTNFTTLVELARKKVLALLLVSQGALSLVKPKREEILEHHLSSFFGHIENNIIVTFLIPDLLKIQMVIDLAVQANLKIIILGRKSEKIIDIALSKKYLKIPENTLINLKNSKDYLKYNNVVVLVFGRRFEAFYRLQRMCKKTDRLMKLHIADKILLFSVDLPGIDKVQNKTIDILARHGFQVEFLIKDLFQNLSYDYQEYLKLLLYLLKPKFFLPIAGEYRHQYYVKKMVQNFNFSDNKIFLIENGDMWFYDGLHKPLIKKNFLKNLGEILIDGTPVIDGNNFIIKDRELLANDGILIIACNLDLRLRKVIGNIDNIKLVSKGFLDKMKIEPLIRQLKELFLKISTQFIHINKQIKWSDFKNSLREELSKFIFKATKKKPVIIPVLISATRSTLNKDLNFNSNIAIESKG